MSDKKKLIIQVRPDGSVHAETVGMYGEECLDYIVALEDLLDAEASESSFTEAYHQVPVRQDDVIGQRNWDGA
ncbi:hypothetical protein GCM10027416_27620 [Okibacterium endophyticum]